MPRTTKRQRERRLEQVEQAVAAEADTGDEWTIEHRAAAPEARPQGLAVDSDERTIAYDFWEAQRECLDRLDDDLDIVAFLGGYRSGKSVTGARWMLTEAVRNPGERFLAMGTTYSEAISTTYRVLFEQLPGQRTHLTTSSFNGPEQSPLVADYNRSEHRLTLVNDSVILLGSADKWSRYAGDEYAGIWLDEPSHYGSDLHDLLEMMSTRLTASAGPKNMFWTLTGNGYNAAWEILAKRQDADGGELGHRIELLRASVLDNPYIAEEDKESLKRQFKGGAREEQALYGGFAAAQGRVYASFERDTHVIEHGEAHELIDDDWRMYGYDAGWNDPRVLVEIGQTAYDQLVVLDEYHESGAHVEDAIDWLAEHDKPHGTIHCEHEPSDIAKFERAGWETEQAAKSLDAGIAEVRRRLESDGNMAITESTKPDPYPFADEPSGTPSTPSHRDRVGLLVADDCDQLIREFLGYKMEEVGTAAADDHCLDSTRYALATVADLSD